MPQNETHQVVAEKGAEAFPAPRTGSTLGIEKLWLLLPVFLIVYKGFIFPLPPLDFWWHLKMGEVIATTESIPRVDSFSFTAAGQPFVVQNWLGELIYFWTYRIGGFPLLVCMATAITLAGFLLMYRLCLDATRNLRVVAVVGFLAALGNYGFLRPQTYSFLLFAAFYLVLEQYRQGRRDRLWILPILMVFWVNLHGAFILGLGLIGLYVAAEGCRRAVDPSTTRALSVVQIRKLLLILSLCVLATLLNPEGAGIFGYVRTVVTDAGSQQLVAEWRPPRVTDFLGFLLFYFPFFLALLTFIYARVKPDFTEIVLFFAFAVFGLISIRNAAWFSTITYPLLARYIPLLDPGPLLPLRRYKVFNRLFRIGFPLRRRLPCLCADQSRADTRCCSGSCHAIAMAQAPAYGRDPAGGTNPGRSGGLYPATRAHGKDFSSSDVRGLLNLAAVAAAAFVCRWACAPVQFGFPQSIRTGR